MSQFYDEEYYISRYVKPFFVKFGLANLYYLWTAYFCLIRPARLKRGSKVLDMGCGVGNLVWALRVLGIKAYGIEPSPIAKKFSRAPQFCIYKSTKKLPFKSREFDLLYSNEVLEHIRRDKLKAFLGECRRVSRGIMIHMICVKERGEIIYSDPTHITLEKEQWWVKKFKEFGSRVRTGNIFYFFPNIFEFFTGKLKIRGFKKGYFILYD